MKRLGKIFLTFILVICVILITATAVLHFVNLNPYRERIASLATKVLGREVKINGHIDINLFPHPEIILNDITIANADWGSEPIMASVKHIDAAFSFLSVFSDTMVVRKARLDDVNVLMEKNEQNLGNWVMGTADPSVKTKTKNTGRDTNALIHLPVMVDMAELNNVTLTVRTTKDTLQVYQLSSFSLLPDESGNLLINSSGELLGNSMVFNGKITSKKSLSAYEAVNVGIQASLGNANLTGQISTSGLATLEDLRGTINIGIEDIQKFLKRFKIEVPLTGPLTVDATTSFDKSVYRTTAEVKVDGITVNAEGLYTGKQMAISSTLAPLRRAGELFGLTNLRADALTLKGKMIVSDAGSFDIESLQTDIGPNRLTAKGSVNTNGDALLFLNLSSPDLNSFHETLPKISLEAKAKAQNSVEKMDVSDLSITFKNSKIHGDIVILKGDKHKINVQMTSNSLDLRPFSQDNRAKQATSTSPGTGNKTSEEKNATENQYIFKTTPIQLPFEANAKIAIDQLFYNFLELRKVKIDTAVHGGQANVKFKCDSANEGYAAVKIDLKTGKAQAILDTVVSVSDFRPKILLAEGVSQTEMPPINISLELQSIGSSPRELASAANGRFLFTQGPGKIKNTIVSTFSGDIFSQLFSTLNPFAKDEEFSNWDCTVFKINLVDGLANIDGMLAQGEKVMILGGGDINLKTERLNIEFNTKPRKGVGISADMFVTPFVKVKGTLASPRIGLNKKGTLLTGGAYVATGGSLVLLKAIFDRTTAAGDKCKEAMEKAGQHTRFDF